MTWIAGRVSAVVGILAATALSAGAFDWQLEKIGHRQFVPVQRVAEFYALETLSGEPDVILLAGPAGRLEAMVDSRQVLVHGVKHWLAFPVVRSGERVLISRFDLVKTIEPALRPARIPGVEPFTTVVVDAGHGGLDHGAAGESGLEKHHALAVSLEIQRLLGESGLQVVLTRDGDYFLTLPERSRRANAVPESIFVSIHFNAAPYGNVANGAEIFSIAPAGVPSTHDDFLSLHHMDSAPGNDFDGPSLALATAVHHALLGTMEDRYDRGVKRARFAVLRGTRAPAILVEGAFLTNSLDDSLAARGEWRRGLAAAIVTGILEYRRLAVDSVPPRTVSEYREGPPSGIALGSETRAVTEAVD